MIKVYKTKKEALENLKKGTPSKFSYYSYDDNDSDYRIAVDEGYFASYKYRGEEKVVTLCKYDIDDLMNNYKKYLDQCKTFREQVYILNYIFTYAILTENWKKFYDIAKTKVKCKKIFNYHRMLNKFQILAILYYVNKTTNSAYYNWAEPTDLYRSMSYMEPKELREVYSNNLFKAIINKLEADKKFRNDSRRSRHYYTSEVLQKIVEIEQDHKALECFLDEGFPKGREEDRWYHKPTQEQTPIKDIINDVKADPERFVSILRNYISNQYVIGKKYAELVFRLKQIYDLLSVCDINASLTDVCEGLPAKIKAQAILAIVGE